ncbi:MAG: alpha-ketoacid dehydrogenase subunit beta [candidate division Zixibacteria bacterium]|nr:alpha-ketoacid dehydrogenase subunit beta [candidate division Zixibacteria bacterium]MCI0595102.1 alpha-ketoacid dehydrogenase subunit beta [candidate division Zixibacteria bacterium]
MGRVITFIDAITEALDQEMARDERVYLIGEDIGLYGGVFKATKGLQKKYGEYRVIDSPISENLIVGAGIGSALVGMRPVPEIQFADFVSPAMDQIVQQAAKIRYRTGGAWSVPLVVRICCGGDVGGGLYHSQINEAWFVHCPGLKVVMPSNPYDAKGLLLAAIRDPDPVLYFEHKRLYRSVKGEVPEGDYAVPIGPAEVKKTGKDMTIVAYALMLVWAMEAAEKLEKEGISCEVIDMKTLLPIDKKTILESVKKTGKALLLQEAPKTAGVMAEISAIITEEAFDYLDAPVMRLAGLDVPPIPFAPPYEKFYLPTVDRIMKKVRQLKAY